MAQRTYAKGKYSLFVCDRCAQWYPYTEQRTELLQFKNIQGTLQRTNLRLCLYCVDTDTKKKYVKTDAQALRHPRVDVPEPPQVTPPNSAVVSPAGLVWSSVTMTWAPPVSTPSPKPGPLPV